MRFLYMMMRVREKSMIIIEYRNFDASTGVLFLYNIYLFFFFFFYIYVANIEKEQPRTRMRHFASETIRLIKLKLRDNGRVLLQYI